MMQSRWRRVVFLIVAGPIFGLSPLEASDGNDLAIEYLQRYNQLAEDDLPGRIALAEWCEQSELAQQAADLYHEILKAEPDNEPAYQALSKIANLNPLPEDEARRAELLEQFPDAFELHPSQHFLVVFNTEGEWARNRAALLEKAHDVFFTTFQRLGYRPLPLQKRLVTVLFDDHTQFMGYARAVDNMQMEWSGGYFSTRTNRTAFFHEKQSPAFLEVRQRISQLEVGVRNMREQLRYAAQRRAHGTAMELRRSISATNKELNWYRNRLDAIARHGNASKTVHEAIHQLAYNSGIQVPGRMYPFWISEGIATNFETDDPAAPFGPMHDNPGRRKILREAFEKEDLVPFADFIVMHKPPGEAAEADRVSIMYSQAWGMFRFLFRYRADETRAYLSTLAAAEPGPREPDQLRKEFIDAYGDLELTEKLVMNYFRRVKP